MTETDTQQETSAAQAFGRIRTPSYDAFGPVSVTPEAYEASLKSARERSERQRALGWKL